jgi:hypothetical protein
MQCEGVDWIELAQDRAQWRVLVNTVTIYRVKAKDMALFDLFRVDSAVFCKLFTAPFNSYSVVAVLD